MLDNGYEKSDYFFGVSLLPIYFVLSVMRFLVVDFGSIFIEIEGSAAKKLVVVLISALAVNTSSHLLLSRMLAPFVLCSCTPFVF